VEVFFAARGRFAAAGLFAGVFFTRGAFDFSSAIFGSESFGAFGTFGSLPVNTSSAFFRASTKKMMWRAEGKSAGV